MYPINEGNRTSQSPNINYRYSTICRDGMTFGTVASSGLIWWSGLEIANLPDPVDLCKAAKWPCKCILLLPEVGDISVLP